MQFIEFANQFFVSKLTSSRQITVTPFATSELKRDCRVHHEMNHSSDQKRPMSRCLEQTIGQGQCSSGRVDRFCQ
jgi:hypothetical protein